MLGVFCDYSKIMIDHAIPLICGIGEGIPFSWSASGIVMVAPGEWRVSYSL